MCIIIEREPNFEIPFKKFETCILNNPDGYGVAVPDGNGKLTVVRSADKPDPEKLYRFINEELIDDRIMIHLRYTTAGATSLRNAHPFPILEKNKHGIDIRMSHNGTISGYVNHKSDESDTRRFVKYFVRPLFERLAKGGEPELILQDKFVEFLLDDQMPAASVLSFIDGNGNTMTVNEKGNGGKREEGWYYSNTYSFDPKHREPTNWWTGSGYYGGYGHNSNQGSYSSPKPAAATSTPAAAGTNVVGLIEHAKDTKVEKFSTKWEIDLREVVNFDDEFINQMIEEEPEDTELLLKELIFELYKKGA